VGNHSTETHENRSSSLSFARRWKRPSKRFVSIVAAASIAFTFMLLFLLQSTSAKSVTVVVDGQEKVVQTREWVLEHLLDEQNIIIDKHDRISKPLTAKIHDGDKIVIERAVPVQLEADGQVKVVYTTGKTVSELLEHMNIKLGKDDKVFPEADAALTANSRVHVVRILKKIEEQEHKLPFKVVKQNDSSLAAGKLKMLRQGEEGIVVKKMEYIFQDGVLVSEQLLDKSIKKPSVDKLVAVGTKSAVAVLSAKSPAVSTLSKNGITFEAKKILKNVTLTAYDAGVSSTGKSKKHPQYGITASGTRVQEGRTISVDPNVIPMGWWVYIEGYGFRRAEDKGSAVKGNKIDIYYDSAKTANSFGTKRGVTVYVIGPNKPK